MTELTGLITPGRLALITPSRDWLVIGLAPLPPPPKISKGRFRFLKDHFVDGIYIFAGEIQEMFDPWVPTPDVEPLDTTAVTSFYAQGPRLGGAIRTLISNINIYPPTTYWKSVSPNVWKLTGLGSNLASIPAILSRPGDKEV